MINEVADRKPFQAAVKPVWDKYGAAAQGADRAHPGREVTRSAGAAGAGCFPRPDAAGLAAGRRWGVQCKRDTSGDGCPPPRLPVRGRRLPGRHHRHHPVRRVLPLRAEQRRVVAGADGHPADDRAVVPVRRRLLPRAPAHRRRPAARRAQRRQQGPARLVHRALHARHQPVHALVRHQAGRRRPGTRASPSFPLVSVGVVLPADPHRRRHHRSCSSSSGSGRNGSSASPQPEAVSTISTE